MKQFETLTTIVAPHEFIPIACRSIKEIFEAEGFDYSVKSELFNKTVIVVSKGNLVKQIVGLKQGLEISFTTSADSIVVKAEPTLFKDQAIATALSLFVTWPVLIPQIIGLIKQAKLDEKAINIVMQTLSAYNESRPVFCPICGKKIVSVDGKCPNCGTLV